MKRLLLLSLVVAPFINAQQDPIALKYSKLIDSAELRSHLTVLASDAYEGRETGKNGQRMAASYIQNSFIKSGLATCPEMEGFQQYYKVIENTPFAKLTINANELTFKTDFIYYASKNKQTYSNLPIHTIETAKKSTDTAFIIAYYIKGMDVRAQVSELKKRLPKGAKSILLVSPAYADLYEAMEHYVLSASMRLADNNNSVAELPILIANAESIKKAFGKSYSNFVENDNKSAKKGKLNFGTFTAELNGKEELLTSSNVLGFIPGTDPVLSKEIIVITAHYDHIGIQDGVVYNGADDDGTGTVALLEIAQALNKAYKDGNGTKRSILIMTVSGEEKGLLGSQYYSEHPIFPLEQTITDLNIDMIGRNDIAHEKTWDYIYIIGSNMLSDDLHNSNELANNTYTQLKLDYKFNSTTDPNQFYYRSDHYNFAKHNIPSIFYFSGVHEDYHQPSDDVEKINFTKVESVTRLVFFTAWQLANASDRPKLN